jgi:GntR family transcriptional regulator
MQQRGHALGTVITFHLDPGAGVAPYLQIVQQVKQALRLGMLEVGDKLPTIREMVSTLAINPNTVFKAYRELEHAGLVASRPGQGTFIVRTLAGPSLASHAALRRSLTRWLQTAHEAGLDAESIQALFTATLQASLQDWEELA